MNENVQMKSSLIHLAAEPQFKSICSKIINILALIHYLHPRIQTSNPFIYGDVQYWASQTPQTKIHLADTILFEWNISIETGNEKTSYERLFQYFQEPAEEKS